jgi:hypothetical protein
MKAVVPEIYIAAPLLAEMFETFKPTVVKFNAPPK